MSYSTPTTYRLGEHNNRLCVVASIPSWTEPVIHDNYWPIGNWSLSDWSEYLGNPMDDGRGDGVFYLAPSEKCRGYSMSLKVAFRLVDGGQTKPIHSVATPIPKPKTRCECWWNQGRWVKRTARGVVDA